jgi:hypothetical protein
LRLGVASKLNAVALGEYLRAVAGLENMVGCKLAVRAVAGIVRYQGVARFVLRLAPVNGSLLVEDFQRLGEVAFMHSIVVSRSWTGTQVK